MSELRERVQHYVSRWSNNYNGESEVALLALIDAELNENLAGMREAFLAALRERRNGLAHEMSAAYVSDASIAIVTNLPNSAADAGVRAIELRKEIALARHIKGGALDGCMCDPCVAVRSLLPQIKETYLETAKQFLRDRPRVVLENPEAAEMQPYVTKEALAGLLRAIEERVRKETA